MIEVIVALLALVFLALLRVPIGVAAGLVGLLGHVYILSLGNFPSYIGGFVFWKLASYELWSIPLFILMGNCLGKCGLGNALLSLSRRFMGGWKGGLGSSVVMGSAGLGALCGSSIAVTIAMGKISTPMMLKQNYPPPLAMSIISIGGSLGMIIPPSVLLILYGILVEADITRLFQAAIIPAMICLVFCIIVIAIHPMLKEVKVKKTKKKPFSWREMEEILPFLICFFVVLGMYIGVVTVIEAAAIGSFVSCLFLKLKGLELKGPFSETAKASSMIFVIILGADLLRSFLAMSGLPYLILEYVADLNPWTILSVYIISLLVLGCVMDTFSILWLTLPILWPVLSGYSFFGMDLDSFKIWFGIIILITIELGMITPPVGLNILTVQNFFPKTKLLSIVKGMSPFLIGELVRLMLLILFPSITLLLPRILS